jgi:hypothetical protein
VVWDDVKIEFKLEMELPIELEGILSLQIGTGSSRKAARLKKASRAGGR